MQSFTMVWQWNPILTVGFNDVLTASIYFWLNELEIKSTIRAMEKWNTCTAVTASTKCVVSQCFTDCSEDIHQSYSCLCLSSLKSPVVAWNTEYEVNSGKFLSQQRGFQELINNQQKKLLIHFCPLKRTSAEVWSWRHWPLVSWWCGMTVLWVKS